MGLRAKIKEVEKSHRKSIDNLNQKFEKEKFERNNLFEKLNAEKKSNRDSEREMSMLIAKHNRKLAQKNAAIEELQKELEKLKAKAFHAEDSKETQQKRLLELKKSGNKAKE